jgi:hypothetical protein
MAVEWVYPVDEPAPPPPDRSLIATDKIAENLKAAILANPTLAAAYTVTRFGSTLHISKATNFTVSVSDTLADTGLSVVKGAVDSEDYLPQGAPTGIVVRVSGDSRTTADDYHVKWNGERWVETVPPGTLQDVDGAHMPWVLASSGTGGGRTFSFGPTTWDRREAGDDSTNPLPSLDSIDTVFVSEGRLGMTSGADIVFSASNAPKRLFRRTVAQLLADEPVAVQASLGHVGHYHDALQWDGALHLWSDRAQLAVYGDPAISPTTITIEPASAFENDPQAPPVVVGTRVYFAKFVNGSTRVYEYSRPPGYDSLPEVRDLTAGVPTYLAGRAWRLVADDALGFLAVVPQGGGSALYVCHLRDGQNGLTQPVWHRWTFAGASLVSARMFGSKLALLLLRSGTLRVELMDPANPADGPATDAGGAEVLPLVTVERLYVALDGAPETTSRVTVRNLTVLHKNTQAGTLSLTGEASPRIDSDVPIPGPATRVPVMRRLEDVGITLAWLGFVTGIELQGSLTSRNRRV